MNRIMPQEVKTAFERHPELQATRSIFTLHRRDGSLFKCCGLAAVALDRKGSLLRLPIDDRSEDVAPVLRVALELGEWYFEGFTHGFDGRPAVAGAKYALESEQGYLDGQAAAAVVFLG